MTDGRKKLPLVGSAPTADEQTEPSALVIDELKERLAQDPDDPGSWLELGGAYLDIDHYAEAANALGRAVELDGDMVVARRSFAHVLAKLERRDEAVYQLVQAKRLAPDEPRILHELGVAFYDKGLYDKALKTLAVAQEHAPDDPMIGYAMGMAYEARGETALAIAKYRSVVKSAPDMIEAHETLADALAAVGELEEAVTQLEAVLRKQRTNTRAALNLEVLRKALGELRSRRLLGQRETAVDDSALVQEAKLVREVDSDASSSLVRYRTGLAQLWAYFDDECVSKLSLIIPDPVKAGLAKGQRAHTGHVAHRTHLAHRPKWRQVVADGTDYTRGKQDGRPAQPIRVHQLPRAHRLLALQPAVGLQVQLARSDAGARVDVHPT